MDRSVLESLRGDRKEAVVRCLLHEVAEPHVSSPSDEELIQVFGRKVGLSISRALYDAYLRGEHLNSQEGSV